MALAESIISLLVGAALFLTGMNMMSDGLKKSTGKGIRNLLKRIQNNRFAGLGIGTIVTAIIQSSAATSIMVVGFINAGAMSVFQGISIIAGAYIGTTATGLLVSLSSFSFGTYLTLLAFVGVVMMFFTNEKVKNIGTILAGLGILFFGLDAMKAAFADPTISGFCVDVFDKIDNPLLLLAVGALFTALVQSSSATSGIVIVMVGNGLITLSNGLFIVLGGTIGTVITTIIATIGSNINSKRVGFICFTMRTILAVAFTLILWPLETNHLVSNLFDSFFATSEVALAMFLLTYNIITMLLFLPFIRPFEKFANRVIRDKSQERMSKTIKFIDDRLIYTPSIAMMQVKKEIINMMTLSMENISLGFNRIINQVDLLDKQIIVNEDKIDFINSKITSFLIALSNKVSSEDENKIGAYFHVINDIERIGDHAYNFYEQSLTMVEKDIKFSEKAVGELNNLYSLIQNMYDLTFNVFKYKEKDKLQPLHELEEEIDKTQAQLSASHYDRITKHECNVATSSYYSTLLSELERVADHLVNIAYSIVNPTGDDE